MIYNIAIHIYLMGVALLSLFDSKVRAMWRGERQAFDILRQKASPDDKYIWFHAASLGEFEQGRPIMEELRHRNPNQKILLTFFSPSGYQVRKNYDGADIVCYLPLDTPHNSRLFLSLINIEAAFFIKYEFWYNYLHKLRSQSVPVYSVSSIFRLGQVFFRPYARSYSKVLRCISHFFVQNEISRQLLASIGINNVTVSGDTRFDRVLQIKSQASRLPLAEAFRGSSRVMVAGSTWPPDEEILAAFFNQNPDWKLIIAPHVVSIAHMRQLLSRLGIKSLLWSRASEAEAAKARCLIIDCYGLLSSVYAYGDVAYVGGGFGVGIHNILEAAVWDIPVLFGPNNANFQEAKALMEVGGGFQIDSLEDFADLMGRFTDNPSLAEECGRKAGDYVSRHSGATRKVLAAIGL